MTPMWSQPKLEEALGVIEIRVPKDEDSSAPNPASSSAAYSPQPTDNNKENH